MTTTSKARHWADLLADDIINQRGRCHVVNTGITPSGEIHVGNMREVVTADAIHRVLAERGDESRLLYIADTYDPLRHVYPFLDPQRYRDEVGRPLSEIPCPCGQHSSYAEHFLAPFLGSLEQLGIRPTVHRADQLYKAGAYSEAIVIALQHCDQIRKILKDNPEEFDPRKYLKPAMEAMAKLCKQRLQEFNTAGQASKIKKVLTPAEMAKRYAKGELDPRTA